MLLEGLEGVGQAAEVAERIKRALTLPFEVDGHEAVVTASIGIAAAGPGESGEEHAEELMRRADVAMYQGKREGKDRHKVFSSPMNHSFERLELEENLRRAIAREELRLYYQPQVGVSTAKWSASRLWSGGSIRSGACCSLRSSSPWPSRRA
jgi:predicted signal transduction protein with EAL and GGDEF domain